MYCPLFFNNIVIISAENNNKYLASNDQAGDFLGRKNFFIRIKNSPTSGLSGFPLSLTPEKLAKIVKSTVSTPPTSLELMFQ